MTLDKSGVGVINAKKETYHLQTRIFLPVFHISNTKNFFDNLGQILSLCCYFFHFLASAPDGEASDDLESRNNRTTSF